MDRIRLDDVAARIVAWHNRHPLARRVAAAHVHGIGEVELPFAVDAQALAAAPEPAVATRGLAAWRAWFVHRRRRELFRPLFGERFIPALSPARVARWARVHGVLTSILPGDWPRRRIRADTRIAMRERSRGRGQAVDLHVLSAAIGVGNRQLRVLLGTGGAVLGDRAYAGARIAGGFAACAAIAVTCAAIVPFGVDAGAAAPPAAASAASAASAAAAAETASRASQAAPAVQASAAARSAETPAPAAAASAPAEPARSEAPAAAVQDARAEIPARISIRPTLSEEERRVAIETGQRLRAAARLQSTQSKTDEEQTAAPAPAPHQPVYALVAPATRQRDESVALLAGAQVLQAMGVAPARSEVFATNGMWRAAFWPYESLAQAERARIALAGKGLKAEVVEF